jgi:hypothetical protein
MPLNPTPAPLEASLRVPMAFISGVHSSYRLALKILSKHKRYFHHDNITETGSAGQFLCNPGSELTCRNITVEGVAIDAKAGCSFHNVYGQGSDNSPASCTPPQWAADERADVGTFK